MSTQNYQEMVNFYHNIMLYCAIAAVVFLVIAIILFIQLKIPQVFGELTGRTAQKAINEMISGGESSGALASAKIGMDGRRQRKAKTGDLSTGGLRKNTGRASGRLNDRPVTGGLGKEMVSAPAVSYEQPTAPMDTFGSSEMQVQDTFGSAETDVLDTFGSAETDVLNPSITAYSTTDKAAVNTEMSQTEPTMPFYQAPESETMVLSQELKSGKSEFVILRSIVEIHTEEVI